MGWCPGEVLLIKLVDSYGQEFSSPLAPVRYSPTLMDWIIRSLRAVAIVDEQEFLWIKKGSGLSEYQMAALGWVKGKDTTTMQQKALEIEHPRTRNCQN